MPRSGRPSPNPNVVPLPRRRRDGGFWRRLAAFARSNPRRGSLLRGRPNPFSPAEPPPGVVGQGRRVVPQMALDAAAEYRRMAFDDGYAGAGGVTTGAGWISGSGQSYWASAYAEGMEWLGYAVLAIMAQRAEYRTMTDTFATEMTREWITFKSRSGDKRLKERIDRIEARLRELKLKDAMCAANRNDGFQGRGQVYVDTGCWDDRDELKRPLDTSTPDGVRAIVAKHGKGKKFIKRLGAIEPMWCYPAAYEASDPLKANWYKPDLWWVMGKEVSRDRLLTFVGHEVSDILKPAYSFGGLSMTQMAKPYVDFWLRNRTSESDLLNNFSMRVLATELDVTTQDEEGELMARIDGLTAYADNQGVVVINKESEEFDIRQTSLGGVPDITRQSMERLTLPSRMPIVKFFGNQPSGLNADSEGVIRMWYDDIRAAQESRNRDVIQRVVELVQIEVLGEIVDDLVWEFEPLWQLDEAGKAAIQKTRADQRAVDIESGAIGTDEARLAAIRDPDGQYSGLDLSDEPPEPPPEEEPSEGRDPGAGGPEPSRRDFAPGLTSSAAKFGGAVTGGFGAKDAADIEFRESDHPRDDAGRFSAGRGGGGRTRHMAAEPGAPLPEHIAALKIPPAWREVTFNPDPEGDLLVTGRDQKGRLQAIYSRRFAESQSALKFARIRELGEKFTRIAAQNEEARRSDDPRRRDSADALKLIMATGIRPGSAADTQAKVKAYGATTLEGRHVVEDGDGNLSLRFVGKKGVPLDIAVHDDGVATLLLRRAREAGPDGKLFPATNHAALLAHTHSLDGGSFKTKDFRTLLGTTLAMRMVEREPAPRTQSEYRKAVMAVAKRVSAALGNTPTVALQSYINPVVFAPWRAGIA